MIALADKTDSPTVAFMQDILKSKFSYFASIIDRQYEQFGPDWLRRFEKEMSTFFGKDRERLAKAVYGYGCFALDGMRLQKEFDRSRSYRHKTYEQAANEVYQNEDYMFNLYLPGILISHYLWRHHYSQHIFYRDKFVPLMRKHGGQLFYDVGVGTGFYSKEMLLSLPNGKGQGFDLSPFSLAHTRKMLEAWKVADRYKPNLQNIITQPVEQQASFIVNVEVLEHLESPQSFLNALNKMLEKGGYGFISAALTAPNADHIYLYNSPEEVIAQLEKAGFKLVEFVEDAAYIPKHSSDSVPRNGAFIVTK